MKIITPEFEASFKDYPIGSQADKKDPLVIERIYNSYTSTEWFLLEYDQTKKFGYGIAKNKVEEKAGFFNLAEMERETLRNPNQNKMVNQFLEKLIIFRLKKSPNQKYW